MKLGTGPRFGTGPKRLNRSRLVLYFVSDRRVEVVVLVSADGDRYRVLCIKLWTRRL